MPETTELKNQANSILPFSPTDQHWMELALNLAKRGEGYVEPNPMVGCVIVSGDRQIAAGWHQRFGGAHAEIIALQSAREPVVSATAYVTLEPCAHFGKTPPCAQALIDAGLARVVVAHIDPNPQVAGKGIQRLREAGIEVEVGLLQEQAAQILAPFLKRMTKGLPWIIGKWAMTLDGKIATASGDSQWISNEKSRHVVHAIRGRVDAILVGSNTARQDNPLLTARPPGPRLATRIVVDSQANIALNSKLCQTATQIPTIVATAKNVDQAKVSLLQDCGCEVWVSDAETHAGRLLELLAELTRRGMTNVLVEGGGQLMGTLLEVQQIDEIHLFLAGKLLGGANAITPVSGRGFDKIIESQNFETQSVQTLDNDVYIVSRCRQIDGGKRCPV